MLTAKQNFRECVKGGKPDRYVNQYEALQLMFHPFLMATPLLQPGQENVVNAWGVTNSFPANTPGSFPVHTPDKIVVKDIEHWQDYVHAPSLQFPNELWDAANGMYNSADGEKCYRPIFIAPGLFEQTHHLCSIDQALMYYITNPDEMHDLIKYLTEWELEMARDICERIHPDSVFHHDDWGSETNSFLRPEMFEEFFLEPYKQIYGYYHDHGCELVIHHGDSYCANLIPTMIEMGIDVWQGCMETNDVPALVAKYGDKITFMGNIDNKSVDFTGWTQADIRKAADKATKDMPLTGYIPCITQGGPGSVFPGTYAALAEEIDKINGEKFGFSKEELDGARLPWQIMF